MPQLDLSWFFMNFMIAWTLIIITWMTINSQKWNNQKDKEHTTKKMKTPTKKWKW